MELKDIVCDRKYAEKLKELGVDQTSSYAVFYGGPNYLSSFREANIDLCGCITDRKTVRAQQYFTATFTIGELLKKLPKNIPHSHSYDGASYYLMMSYDGECGYPIAWYEDDDLLPKAEFLVTKSDKKKLVNALAKMLIHLIKKDIISFNKPAVMLKKDRKGKDAPPERVVHTKMLKRYYSFKYNCWFLKTRVKVESATPRGYWHCCDLINEATGEGLENFMAVSPADLARRVLEFVNNPKMF